MQQWKVQLKILCPPGTFENQLETVTTWTKVYVSARDAVEAEALARARFSPRDIIEVLPPEDV
jgi:hypothetical protein